MFSRFFIFRVSVLMALLLVSVPRAGAEPIHWSYQEQLAYFGPGPLPPGPQLYGNGFDQFQIADVKGAGSGSTSVTAFRMRASTVFGGLFFDIPQYPYSIVSGLFPSVTIRDTASGASGTVTFHATLEGYMARDTASLTISTMPLDRVMATYGRTLAGTMKYFTDVLDQHPKFGVVNVQVGFQGPTQQKLALGEHLYTISIQPYNFQLTQDLAKIGWNLDRLHPFYSAYQDVPMTVQVRELPEPSTLVLAALGLSGLGLRAWRRRRTPVNR
jgi:hypothetical protein